MDINEHERACSMQYSNIPVGCTPPSKESQLFISLMFFLVHNSLLYTICTRLDVHFPRRIVGRSCSSKARKPYFQTNPYIDICRGGGTI